MMDRRDFLKAGSAVTAAMLGTNALAQNDSVTVSPTERAQHGPAVSPVTNADRPMTSRPNIVLIIADDATPSYHGCYGGPTPTPNIDRLATQGARFERAYCSGSLCNPSRYTLFTGRYPGRTPSVYAKVPIDQPYTVSQNAQLDPDTPTLPRMLTAAGYFTGHIGKWHSRFDTGFLNEPEPVLVQGDPDAPAVDAELRRRQLVAQKVVQQCAGFTWVDRVQWGNIGKGHAKLTKHNPMWMTDGALVFLEEAKKRAQPFYLHVAAGVPHGPDPNKSLNVDHRYTWGGKLDEAPKSHPPDDTVLERLRAAGLQTEGPIAGVNAGMVMLDDQVGAILQKLEALGQLDNTIIIYTADHGIPGKGSCYAIGQHMPLLIHRPGTIAPGTVISQVCSLVDVVPTLAEACGVMLPSTHPADGVSLLPALRGHNPWPRRYAYHEMGWARSIHDERHHYIAVRPPAQVIAQFREGRGEPGQGIMFDKLNAQSFPDYFAPDQLYDLHTDPLERVNLINDPTRAAVVARLKTELACITDTMPRPFPAQPDAIVNQPVYRELLERRKAELYAVKHYPKGDVPRIWHSNLADPDAPPL